MRVQWVEGAVLAALVVSTLAGCFPVAPQPTPTVTAAQVVYVADGDTITVRIDGRDQRVRLLGIDAPEEIHGGQPAQCGAAAATATLRAAVDHHTVQLVSDPKADSQDRYGRWLRYVELNGIDVGRQQLAVGVAAAWWPTDAPAPSRGHDYQSTTATARDQRTGQWALCQRLGRA